MSNLDNFSVWYSALNKACWKAFGVDLEDMPDQPYQEWHEDGLSIVDAIAELEEEFYDDTSEYYDYSDADPGL